MIFFFKSTFVDIAHHTLWTPPPRSATEIYGGRSVRHSPRISTELRRQSSGRPRAGNNELNRRYCYSPRGPNEQQNAVHPMIVSSASSDSSTPIGRPPLNRREGPVNRSRSRRFFFLILLGFLKTGTVSIVLGSENERHAEGGRAAASSGKTS